MAPVPLILMVFAFVFFVVAAWSPPQAAPYWNRLVALGLAFWSFVIILGYTGILGK